MKPGIQCLHFKLHFITNGQFFAEHRTIYLKECPVSEFTSTARRTRPRSAAGWATSPPNSAVSTWPARSWTWAPPRSSSPTLTFPWAARPPSSVTPSWFMMTTLQNIGGRGWRAPPSGASTDTRHVHNVFTLGPCNFNAESQRPGTFCKHHLLSQGSLNCFHFYHRAQFSHAKWSALERELRLCRCTGLLCSENFMFYTFSARIFRNRPSCTSSFKFAPLQSELLIKLAILHPKAPNSIILSKVPFHIPSKSQQCTPQIVL